ncbi:MAG: DUF1207 domain-containing protein [Candidatus Rokubacteria bacterium]|nr:DUF1207 domain-containing protein [Candidatus Rokubacteria bacterium]
MRRLALVMLLILGPGALARPAPALAATVAPEDAYLHGYAAAVLEREFGVTAPSLRVQHGVLTLGAADLAGVDRERVVAGLTTIRGVARVEVQDRPPAGAPAPAAEAGPAPPLRVLREYETGVMPKGELFTPLIADPRWPHFSAAHHYYLNDPDFTNVAAVSFGEAFPVYRDRAGRGWWELGIQAGVFAVFDVDADSGDLINSDYFVAGAVAYRSGDFSGLGRVFHQSSHLGDEFLLRATRPERVNVSYEGIDAKLSYELFDTALRMYAGGGYLVRRDPTDLDPWSTQVGLEFRSPWPSADVGWRPIAAADLQNREENGWATDISLRAGLQFDGLLVTRNLQLLLEYFNGHSPNGQFYRRKIDYIGLGVHFHL